MSCCITPVFEGVGSLPLNLVHDDFRPEAREHSEKPRAILKKDILKEEHIEVEGIVAAVLAGTMFRVELDNKHLVLATICGKMRKRWVRLTVGDRVKMEMSPYDLSKARITWRLK